MDRHYRFTYRFAFPGQRLVTVTDAGDLDEARRKADAEIRVEYGFLNVGAEIETTHFWDMYGFRDERNSTEWTLLPETAPEPPEQDEIPEALTEFLQGSRDRDYYEISRDVVGDSGLWEPKRTCVRGETEAADRARLMRSSGMRDVGVRKCLDSEHAHA